MVNTQRSLIAETEAIKQAHEKKVNEQKQTFDTDLRTVKHRLQQTLTDMRDSTIQKSDAYLNIPVKRLLRRVEKMARQNKIPIMITKQVEVSKEHSTGDFTGRGCSTSLSSGPVFSSKAAASPSDINEPPQPVRENTLPHCIVQNNTISSMPLAISSMPCSVPSRSLGLVRTPNVFFDP